MRKTRIIWLAQLALICAFVSACGGESTGTDELRSTPEWLVGPIIAISTLSSEDLACISAGILASQEVIGFWPAVFWCWVGILGGDIGLYLIGLYGGTAVAKWRFFRRILTTERLEQGKRMFESHGAWVLFTSRFLPGSRLPAYVAAGMVKYSLLKFTIFLAIAGGLWTPVIVGLSWRSGEEIKHWLEGYEQWVWPALIAAIFIIWMLVEFILPLFSHKGRRLVAAKFHRIAEWEFWPMWAFYPPVIAYLARLAIKHRSFTVFTASNPAIPSSGLAMESKSQILTGLAGKAEQDPRIATWKLIPSSESLERKGSLLAEFQSEHGLDFPIVLKPDIGERGQGVSIIKTPDAAEKFLEQCQDDVIAQEYISGPEFGVFYYRLPEAESGELLSITEKKLLTITGDGKKTLENLIIDDDRAVKMAKFFLRKHAARLDTIPKANEIITLADLGTHCRGAVFTDAREHATEALRCAIDELSQQFEGFYFGRYDLRVSSVEALREGRDFRILELNGVTSEATHIYHPGYKLTQAYRDLAEQWRIAFEIGSANVENGAHALTLREIAALIGSHRKRTKFEAD